MIKQNLSSNKQKGQVILILILVMTVALSIGLSVVQKSLVDVSTASKAEQSSRAFSAAEAGIEKALQNNGTTCGDDCVSFTENNSKADVSGTSLIPTVPDEGIPQDPLEIPPLAKEDVAQVWLADPTANLPSCTGGTSNVCYTQNSLDFYWGNPSTDKAAVEITLVYHDGTKYAYHKWYFDPSATRSSANGFDSASPNCLGHIVGTNTYQCKNTLAFTTTEASGLMLLRARLLYNTTSQPIAVRSTVTCPLSASSCASYSLPPQARSIISTGISGETQRKVNVFQLEKVVPPYFDYAIFSAGDIKK